MDANFCPFKNNLFLGSQFPDPTRVTGRIVEYWMINLKEYGKKMTMALFEVLPKPLAGETKKFHARSAFRS